MTDELKDFFKSKGIKKIIPEFNQSQEQQIQIIIENVYKPVFTELSEELSSFANIRADMMVSKRTMDSIKEEIELKVYRTMQAKFFYRPKFLVENNDIFVIGQFCIPNFYGEGLTYRDTEFKRIITDINEVAIKDDFMKAFTENVDLK